MGAQTAIVVGPSGQSAPSGADEIHTDRQGRIRVRFHWQQGDRADDRSSCWLRVAMALAGSGQGLQFIPRIGHEVLVQFMDGDVDQPVVVGSLYSGQGEAGSRPTPGGRAASAATPNDDTQAAQLFAQATDHTSSAQGARIGASTPPAWHGAAAGEQAQRNAAALSGFKTKEFGGEGSNQLLFDDSDGQLAASLQTTSFATWLNLGHLLHRADNFRGSFRGAGFELRSDAYGAIRGQSGVLLTSYGTAPGEPAGDNAAGIALAKQAQALAKTFSQAAKTHQGTPLASYEGVSAAFKSSLDKTLGPVAALRTALQGMVHGSDFAQAEADTAQELTKTTSTQDAADGTPRVPHTSAPIIAISAKAGLVQAAGQDLQVAAGETVNLSSGQDSQWAVGHQMRIHTGQSIGLTAGVVQSGKEAGASTAPGKGITLIAGRGDIDVQAQADRLQLAAQKTLVIQSGTKYIDLSAAKKITIKNAAGSAIVIDKDGVRFMCTGTIAVKAGSKSLVGPAKIDYASPHFPTSELVPMLSVALQSHAGSGTGTSYANEPYKLFADGGLIEQGLTNDQGAVRFKHRVGVNTYRVELLNGQTFEVDALSAFSSNPLQREAQQLANEGFRDEPSTKPGEKGGFASEAEQRRSLRATQDGLDATRKS